MRRSAGYPEPFDGSFDDNCRCESSPTILSDRASRAVAYVGMTRSRDENHLAIYPAVTNEAHQHHHDADEGIHQIHGGTKHAAAHALHAILTGNDDRARTMHTVAARTDHNLLPTIVAALLERKRRADRAQAWHRHTAQTRVREAALERITATRQQTAERQPGRDQGYGLELLVLSKSLRHNSVV
jgi:hypothetical protein